MPIILIIFYLIIFVKKKYDIYYYNCSSISGIKENEILSIININTLDYWCTNFVQDLWHSVSSWVISSNLRE